MTWAKFKALEPFRQGKLGEALQGRLAGRVLHIGTCSSAALEPSDRDSLQALPRLTRAARVTGYTEAVDRVESVAFETCLLDSTGQLDAVGQFL